MHVHGECHLSGTRLVAIKTGIFQRHVFGLDVMPHVASVLG